MHYSVLAFTHLSGWPALTDLSFLYLKKKGVEWLWDFTDNTVIFEEAAHGPGILKISTSAEENAASYRLNIFPLLNRHAILPESTIT